jgi:2,5-furandicarboxylate decarboxylase 1
MTGRRDFLDQDLHAFVDAYQRAHAEDVLVVEETLDPDQDATALVFELHRAGRAPMILCRSVAGMDVPLLTNVFASRLRVARMLGTEPSHLHEVFARSAAERMPPKVVATGPALDIQQVDVDLGSLPMIRHFEQDAAPYLTSAIVVALDPETGVGNTSYHRSMVSSGRTLATSLHSRGHLWRYLQNAADRGASLPVAVVIGGHPLFMLAASSRVGIDVDEREIAGGLFGRPLEVVPTPRYGIGVPATSDLVLEGFIDPSARADEGPFGEYSGYASSRSTNNVIEVQTILRRKDAMVLDVVSGHASDHLNLGRIPRESELLARLRERFPEVVAIDYPASGTHFHCYVSMRPRMEGQARQTLLALLGMDPYLKLAVAVDDDVDVRREDEVLWAVATRFQADRDLFVIGGVPGSLLDPSSEGGITSRMGIDATRKPGFDADRVSLSARSLERARHLLGA